MKIKSILISMMMLLLLGSLFATPAIFNYMDMNGTVGAAYKLMSDDDTSDADVVVTNFDLDLTLNPSDIFSAYLALDYSNDMDYMYVDEAYAKVRMMEEYPLHVTAGQFYMPTSIDKAESNFYSDPLTYSFAEMPEIGLMADFGWKTLTLKTAFFKEVGNDSDEDTNIDAFVVNLVTEHEIEDGKVMVSGSYTSNIGVSGIFEAPMTGDDAVAAVTLGAMANWRDWGFLGEYLMTLDDIGEDPISVMHAELSFAAIPDWVFAAKYEMSQEADAFLPETVVGGVASYTFMRNSFSEASVGAEYLMETDYNEDSTNNAIVKLTYKF